MTFKYLCPQHRQWLYLHPNIVCTEQMKNYDTAEYYRDLGHLSDAANFAGCAYECAEIILTLHAKDIIASVLSFTASSILLADSLFRLGHAEQGKRVFEHAKSRLDAEKNLHFGDKEALICIKACITSLADGVSFYDTLSLADQSAVEPPQTYDSLHRVQSQSVH